VPLFTPRDASTSRRLPTGAQLKHVGRYLSERDRSMVKAFVAIAILSAGAMAGKFSYDHLRRVPALGGDYVEATVGEPHFVNPVLASTNDVDLDITRLVFSGLMQTNTQGEIVHDIANSHTVSDDGKTYTFTLRPNVEWHDGTQFSSRDVAMTVNAIKNPAWKSSHAADFKGVTVAAPDDHTVVFTLAEPSPNFLEATTIGILPEHLWQDVVPENAVRAELNVKPVGTGPYRFKSFAKDSKGSIHTYTLARNDKYYGQTPHLDSFTFRTYPDFGEAVQALMKRKVSASSFLPSENDEAVRNVDAVTVHRYRLPQYTAIFFNLERTAQFPLDVRRALAMGIDRDKLLREALADRDVAAYGPLLPGLAAFTPDIPKIGYDPEGAAKLLDQAGFVVGEGGKRAKKTVPLTLKVTTTDTTEMHAVAERIKADWEALGATVEIIAVPRARIAKEQIRTKDYDVVLYGEIVGMDGDLLPFWHSTQAAPGGLNLSLWKNKDADALLDKARAATTESARTDALRSFQTKLLADVPAIFLYSPTYPYPALRAIKGIEGGILFSPANRFSGVENWYVETNLSWQ
jgi:peptide/nickel transport system substrate-binding protein